MQISLQWVNELVSIESVKLADLIEKLTLGGFEVEETLELEINARKTIALDISATANRSDSLSIKGISKEVAALLNKSYKSSKYLRNNLDIEWKNQITNSCSNYLESDNYSTFLAVTVENLINFVSPKWLKNKLISSGFTPLNNLLDFQNYILIETGYPFEFYDLDKINSNLESTNFDLTLTQSKNNQPFVGGNNQEYILDSNISIIKVKNLTLGVAGIISHKDFSYINQTKSLLIEGAIFNSKKIRQQSRLLGLRTDRSARYEKDLKNSFLIESLYRLISLLKVSNPNLICKLHTISQTLQPRIQNITLTYENINEILGPVIKNSTEESKYITQIQITDYLSRLNFNFVFDEFKTSWNIEIPNSRSDDLTREIDLIEEIGRLHGFNNFVTNLPEIKTIGTEDFSYQARRKITSCFLNLGFNELIEYSLVNECTFVSNDIKLVNPLISDCSSLRSSLLPNIIETVSKNLKQGNLSLEGFEYGHVFSGNISSDFIETEKIAGIFGGIKPKQSWSNTAKSFSWFEGKGKIEQIFHKLNLSVYWKNSLLLPYNEILHPYRSAKLSLLTGKSLGVFGQIHPIIAKKRNLPNDLYLFEFDFELLKTSLKANKIPVYKQYSCYPKIIKDLSFIVNQTISFEDLKNTIIDNGTEFLVQVKLLDEYRGNSIPKTHTSLCIQLIFQSTEKTLLNKEVETIVNKLQTILINLYDIAFRV